MSCDAARKEIEVVQLGVSGKDLWRNKALELNKKDGIDSIIEPVERYAEEFEARREGNIVIVKSK